jgi:hypothetical protein
MTSSLANKWQGIVEITRADKPMMVTYLFLQNAQHNRSVLSPNSQEKA